MFQILSFIAKCIGDLASIFFRIDIGGISLGLLMCLCFIFLPITLRIIKFIRQDALDELDDKYDESRPRESWTSNDVQYYNPTTGKAYSYFTTNHRRSRSRRYRIR